jgi:hypothetical protein
MRLSSYISDATGYGYVNGAMKTFTIGDTTGGTRITVTMGEIPAADATVEIPVLQYAAIGSSEGYQFFYKTTPYQGLLDSTSVTGDVKVEGPAIVTTAGSGSIVTQATNQTNIIDRMPALDEDKDCLGDYSQISMSNTAEDPTLEIKAVSKPQDILDVPPQTPLIGLSAADRGRSGVDLSGSYLTLKLGKLDTMGSYQKTYQSYLLDKDCSGELYLMVVGSEIDNTVVSRYLFSGSDSVDIFRMPGQPVTFRG